MQDDAASAAVPVFPEPPPLSRPAELARHILDVIETLRREAKSQFVAHFDARDTYTNWHRVIGYPLFKSEIRARNTRGEQEAGTVWTTDRPDATYTDWQVAVAWREIWRASGWQPPPQREGGIFDVLGE